MNGVFCEGFDVTDRVEAGAGLLAAEERLRLATEAADIGWWDVEEGHGELFWPPRVKAMFGISADAPVSLDDFYAGLHPDDRDHVAAAYEGAADPARRDLYDVEYRTIGKEDGVVRWVAAKGRGVFDKAGRCKRVIGTAIDITERKLAQEEKLARQKEDAELRDQFIAVLGHDLCNPLASVAAATHALARRPERAPEMAQLIQRSIARMSELIENVLDFARGRLGGGFVIARNSDKPLTPVLQQVIEELREVHPERDIAVDIDLREPVACDPQRIGQLLSNLLGNAFVYGTPTLPIQVRARAEGGAFELSVANSGEAIEPSALERLFLPFFRGKARGSRQGLGLGLYICSEIAKAHGGTIVVTSDSELTCFTLRMPTRAEGGVI
jgi:PAS domain S-box-containing protein